MNYNASQQQLSMKCKNFPGIKFLTKIEKKFQKGNLGE